jgi:P pilus assembly chaperone PapD
VNRWVWPGAVAGVVVVATVAASFGGAQPLPETPFAAAETRASAVCPAFQSATATIRVAAASAGPGLRTGRVTDPGSATDVSGLHVANAPGVPQRISALLPGPFGGTTSVAAEAGADRGFSLVACAAPGTDHWFTGVDIRDSAQSEVVVANLDGTDAAVDLTVYGAKGRLAAPRGLTVAGNAVQTISLGTLERSSGPVTVEVGSSDGRVAAFVRQRTWAGKDPLGADWLAEGTAPASDLVIAGVPAGGGQRTLVVTNPGERTATVQLGSLTTAGPGGIVGAEQVEVPPQTTRSVDLEEGLDGQSAAVRLTSNQPVTAAVWLDTSASDARHDPAYTVATEPLPADSLWPLALGKEATTVLQLANPGEAEAVAAVTAGAGASTGEPTRVTVPAGSIVEVPLDRSATNLVRVQTDATDLRGALVSTARLGKVRGLAVLDLVGEGSRTQSAVVFDPRAGS